MRAFVAAFLFTALFSLTAAAGSIDRVSPASFFAGNPEQFIAIFGTGLAGSDSTAVVFAGPAGTFRIIPNVASDTRLDVWVPVEVTLTEGRYSIDVYATDLDGTTRHLGPAFFDVVVEVIQAPPLLSIPEVVVAEAASASGAVVFFNATGVSQGGSGLSVTCDHQTGTQFPLGPTIVNCTASDSFGSASGAFTVFVTDTAPPVLSLPAPIVTGDPVVTYTASATDAIAGSVPVTCTPSSGSTFPVGMTIVNCVAKDSFANFATGSFTVTVNGGPPVLNLPADIVAEATSASGAAVAYVVTATENGVVACTPPSGSTFALGATTVNCTATNGAGSSSGSFKVTVVDTTPPAMTLPANITAEATSPSGAVVTWVAKATDLVDGNVAVSCTPASGATFALGTATVQCAATDAHGNRSTGSFTVTVQDTTPPEFLRLTATPDTLWPPDHKMVAVKIEAVTFDAADTNPAVHIASVSSDQPVNGTGDGDTAPDWEITGSMTLNLRAERAGNKDRKYTIVVEASDFSGNVSRKSVEVKVTQANRSRAVR